MKLSTKTRYGMRAMFELARQHNHGHVQIKIIAHNQDISIKYLEQLMSMLKAGGFIRSLRGAKGGYLLAKPPNQIKLSDIFCCLEGPVVTVECVEDENFCERFSDCITREVWLQVQNAIIDVLQSLTLQDLIDKAKKAKKSKTTNYQI